MKVDAITKVVIHRAMSVTKIDMGNPGRLAVTDALHVTQNPLRHAFLWIDSRWSQPVKLCPDSNIVEFVLNVCGIVV